MGNSLAKQDGKRCIMYELERGNDGRQPLFSKVQTLHPHEAHRSVTPESAMHYCQKLCQKASDSGKQRRKMMDAIKLDRQRKDVRQNQKALCVCSLFDRFCNLYNSYWIIFIHCK